MKADVIIAGAGHAGGMCAVSLRQAGFGGSILMVGEEPQPPYERPPLSKAYLSGEMDAHRLNLRKPDYYAERNVSLMLGRRVEKVRPDRKQVDLCSGQLVDYGHLIWAAGGRARKLTCPGAHLAGVHTLRTIADVDRIRTEVEAARQIVIIGGGYIGLETAAVLRKLGKPVTLIEALDRVLARVTCETLSRFYEMTHRGHGVDLRTGVGVQALIGTERVSGVALADGTSLPADLVIVGIGIAPNVEELERAGVACANAAPGGVLVDAFCQTSDPSILAIGDCANHENAFGAGRIRLESVQNAIDQAKVAASVVVGQPERYHALPWFWSDQYDLKLQTAGLAAGHDQIVVRGDAAKAPFSIAYLKAGRLIALDAVNAIKDFMAAKNLIQAGKPLDLGKLADPTFPLKELLTS
jgi:3-phenylpropionate/trans-cinnamate dioxygenase ferredoxin reductase component